MLELPSVLQLVAVFNGVAAELSNSVQRFPSPLDQVA